MTTNIGTVCVIDRFCCRYVGPELEVWSMGVTLYTLMFSENPFFDVDETIKAELQPPFFVTTGTSVHPSQSPLHLVRMHRYNIAPLPLAALHDLLGAMLHKSPHSRATIPFLQRNEWIHQEVNISRYSWHDVVPPRSTSTQED